MLPGCFHALTGARGVPLPERISDERPKREHLSEVAPGRCEGSLERVEIHTAPELEQVSPPVAAFFRFTCVHEKQKKNRQEIYGEKKK